MCLIESDAQCSGDQLNRTQLDRVESVAVSVDKSGHVGAKQSCRALSVGASLGCLGPAAQADILDTDIFPVYIRQ